MKTRLYNQEGAFTFLCDMLLKNVWRLLRFTLSTRLQQLTYLCQRRLHATSNIPKTIKSSVSWQRRFRVADVCVPVFCSFNDALLLIGQRLPANDVSRPQPTLPMDCCRVGLLWTLMRMRESHRVLFSGRPLASHPSRPTPPLPLSKTWWCERDAEEGGCESDR